MNTIYRIKTAIVCGLRREFLRNNQFLRPNLRLQASLDANNSFAIYLPDTKIHRLIELGKVYEHAKLQLDRLSNKRVVRL